MPDFDDYMLKKLRKLIKSRTSRVFRFRMDRCLCSLRRFAGD